MASSYQRQRMGQNLIFLIIITMVIIEFNYLFQFSSYPWKGIIKELVQENQINQ